MRSNETSIRVLRGEEVSFTNEARSTQNSALARQCRVVSLLNLPAGVRDGAMIAAAKVRADLLQRQRGEPARQVHRKLSREQGTA